MIGLYVHLPFCAKKCHYCDFTIAIAGSRETHARLLSALEREIDERAPSVAGRVFETLYLGGGTPTALRADEITRALAALRRAFCWKDGAEVTCEANPGDVDRTLARELAGLGVNRASLGAQSFNDATLGKMNRSHRASDTGASLEALRGAGIVNVNLDLMLALPGETLPDVERSLAECVRLGPEHVSLYELAIEPRTQFAKLALAGRLERPSEDEALEMIAAARRLLAARGFEHYELLNHAKPGFRSRHNLLYWANSEYLGLGPGAWSYLGGRRFRIASDVADYIAKAERGDWTPCDEDRVPPDERENESLLLALRLVEGAEISRFARAIALRADEIERLADANLLERLPAGQAGAAGRLRLTERGRLLAETVFTELSGPGTSSRDRSVC